MSATFEGSGHRQHFTLNAIVQLYDIKFSYVRYFPTTKHTAHVGNLLSGGERSLEKKEREKERKKGKGRRKKGRKKGERGYDKQNYVSTLLYTASLRPPSKSARQAKLMCTK